MKYKFIISYDEANGWPAVKSGFMPLKEARNMFLSYFDKDKRIELNF